VKKTRVQNSIEGLATLPLHFTSQRERDEEEEEALREGGPDLDGTLYAYCKVDFPPFAPFDASLIEMGLNGATFTTNQPVKLMTKRMECHFTTSSADIPCAEMRRSAPVGGRTFSERRVFEVMKIWIPSANLRLTATTAGRKERGGNIQMESRRANIRHIYDARALPLRSAPLVTENQSLVLLAFCLPPDFFFQEERKGVAP